MMQIETKHAIIRYLLGDVSNEERDWVEEQLSLGDEEFLDQCQEFEDQLIDDYVLGHLEPRERELLEKNFIRSPRRLDKLRLAQRLMEYAHDSTQFQAQRKNRTGSILERLSSNWKTWQRVAAPAFLMAGVLALVFSGVWTARSQRLMRERQDEHQAAERRLLEMIGAKQKQLLEKEELIRQMTGRTQHEQQVQKVSSSTKLVAEATLFPVSFRATQEEPREVVVSGATTSVRLQLVIDPEANYGQYEVDLQPAGGDGVLMIPHLRSTRRKSGERVLLLRLQPNLLKDADYTAVVKGRETSGGIPILGTYRIRVKKK